MAPRIIALALTKRVGGRSWMAKNYTAPPGACPPRDAWTAPASAQAMRGRSRAIACV